MKVTKVAFRKYFFSDSPLKGVCSVTFDDVFVVHDIKVIEAAEKIFIVMPGKASPSGEYRDQAHPITPEFRKELQKEVLDVYYAGLEAAREEAEKREAEKEDLSV